MVILCGYSVSCGRYKNKEKRPRFCEKTLSSDTMGFNGSMVVCTLPSGEISEKTVGVTGVRVPPMKRGQK